ncbi:hypothetical protein BDW02DRAFT_211592 [Decorospora gaudefroyi]|uniref:Uncharacterized protein n=1 Tax=Decorospora gaudefroyi TaxID=184978 RepID=A0A6A5KQH9_9PLEO|nr:hypothetical protein BDW02DRAFT_211592 [Decorospora gaudefroyi]
MDIRKWLDETVQSGAPHELRSIDRTQKPEHKERKRRRKRSKSDSSILDPPPRPHKPPTNAREAPNEADDSASEAPQTTLSRSSNSSRYARKPRRKTRPAHYGASRVAVEERGTHAHQREKGESKKPRRKSRRKTGERPGIAGIVQDFHAKNVSGDRLTLKPREQLGLFNKGRTSTAVKGRGLPDLVFSEMKFLQKHEDQRELIAQSVPKKKRRNNNTQIKEGEISTFFTSKGPALAEKHAKHIVDMRPGHNILDSQRRDPAHSPRDVAAVDTIETANNAPYLGFGGRGPRHDSTSYVSWSESIRGPSTTPARPRVEAAPHTEQRDSRHQGGKGARCDGEESSFKQPAPPSVTKQRMNDTAERFLVSSVAPTHNRVSRSQSYPQHTSSPRRPNLVDRSAKFHSTGTACSPSSMPPFAPAGPIRDSKQTQATSSTRDERCGTSPISGATALPNRPRHEPNSLHNEVDDDLPTSSDLGSVLRQCNDTFTGRRRGGTLRPTHSEQKDTPYSTYLVRRQSNTDSYPTIRRMSTVRFAEPQYYESVLPNFAGPSIYEQQAQRQQLPLQAVFEGDTYRESYPMEQEYLDENDEMPYDAQGLETLSEPEQPISYGLEGDFGMYDAGGDVTAMVQGVGQNLKSENNVVAPGFWRPNKLY